MRGVMFSNFVANKLDSQKVDHGPTLALRLVIRFARKNSPSGNQALIFKILFYEFRNKLNANLCSKILCFHERSL